MRALVTQLKDDTKRENVLIDDWPDPASVFGNKVKTETLMTGVTNGTERNILVRGNYAPPEDRLPITPGYQNVGRVVEIGPDVKDLEVGDLLFMSQPHVEYCVVSEDDLLVKLPQEVKRQEAALFGMASVSMRSVRNLAPNMGDRILAVGAGCIGQFATQIATAVGACVELCDVDPRRLEVAEDIGAADRVIEVSGDKWSNEIESASYDAVLDFAGGSDMENDLIDAVRRDGTVLFIAGRSNVNYNFNLGQKRRITLKQNGHFSRDDLSSLCRMVQKRIVKIHPVIQDVVSVEEAHSVYETLREEPHRLYGTVFTWKSV